MKDEPSKAEKNHLLTKCQCCGQNVAEISACPTCKKLICVNCKDKNSTLCVNCSNKLSQNPAGFYEDFPDSFIGVDSENEEYLEIDASCCPFDEEEGGEDEYIRQEEEFLADEAWDREHDDYGFNNARNDFNEETNNTTQLHNKYFGLSTLYHITPIENIHTILLYGLFSHNLVNAENLSVASCSRSEIQERRSKILIGGKPATDFVPLFFSERPPMLFEIQRKYPGRKMVYICIRAEIIGEKGVCFSDGNIANTQEIAGMKHSTKIYSELKDLEKLDWKRIKQFDQVNCFFDEAKRIKSAEVLVPAKIDHSWIEKLIVPDDEAKSSLEEETLFPGSYDIPVEVKSDFYFYPKAK